jgi:hypothetical protein
MQVIFLRSSLITTTKSAQNLAPSTLMNHAAREIWGHPATEGTSCNRSHARRPKTPERESVTDAAAVADLASQTGIVIECCGPRDEVLKVMAPLNIDTDLFASTLGRLAEAKRRRRRQFGKLSGCAPGALIEQDCRKFWQVRAGHGHVR